ncbi:MAG: hypothetical protein Q8Q08_04655 [Candidatus Omnitrophota bacterium]|nr:hypothetical protein [Candidatus Omnitrophota bacterium]MDZ4241350.1 hypothetical protein [Candidatus Omnitrophota bacterium]
MKNRWLKIFAVVLAVLLGLAVIKDFLIKSAITSIGSSVVGAPLRVGHFSLNLLTQKVRIKNILLYNPPGFPDEPLIDIPEIGVDYDLPALLRRKLHTPLIIVNVKEMTVIKNKDGSLNVDSLKVAQVQAKDQKKGESKDKKKPAGDMVMQIDEMRLTVGRVIFKDYTKGTEPKIEVFDVGMKDKVFKNITSAEQMATLIMVQAMSPTAIQGAKIYGAAAILGVGFLPAGVAGMLLGNDDSTADVSQGFDKAYDTALAVVKETGELKSEDRAKGVIKVKIDGADVAIAVEKSAKGSTIKVSARKFMIPKPEVAGGVLYRITERLK